LAGAGIVTRPISGGPRLEITPSAGDYDQLCEDLAVLRKGGDESNTEAVLRAVHEAAERVRLRGGVEPTPPQIRAVPRPPERQQEVES
jgi:hypothetical protein